MKTNALYRQLGHERGCSYGNSTIEGRGKRLSTVEVMVRCNLPETGMNTGKIRL